MYTEEKPRRGGLLKEFVARLILIIIFVLLLLWVIPWSKMDVNPLKDQIFNANLQTMKEAGISYFTTERLPKEVGDKVTLTLQKMLDLKLVVPFTDRNGKSCDVKKSYITLEKQETEYLMKVNLKCGEEEDYILVHLGCYSYCTSAICEAKKTEKTTTKVKVTPTPTNKTPKPTRKPTPTATPKPTSTPTPTPTPTSTPKPTPTPTSVTRLYEYKKVEKTTTNAVYSKWSNWTEYVKHKDDGVVYGKTATKEVEDLGTRYVKIGEKAATYITTRTIEYEPTVVGYHNYTLCTGYKYFADAKTVYRIESDWTYATGADAYYEGYNPPADSISNGVQVHYTPVSIKYDVCKENCVNNPYIVYRKQTRKLKAYTEYTNVTSECSETKEYSVPITVNKSVVKEKTMLLTPAQSLYAHVRYYRVRTRQLLSEGTTSTKTFIKWSTYNDTSLLNSGYYYTGNYK